MRKLRALGLRILGLFKRSRADDDFAAELESHIALHTDDGIRAGLTPEEARRRALIYLGGSEQTRRASRKFPPPGGPRSELPQDQTNPATTRTPIASLQKSAYPFWEIVALPAI